MNVDSLQNLGIEFHPNARLSDFTTFRLGGACRGLFSCQTSRQIKILIESLIRDHAPFILIGGGSNLVVSDDGIDCFVIRYYSQAPLIQRDGNVLEVEASTQLNDLTLYAAKNGLAGLNSLSDIPGTLGGAIVGNAGAFGKQIGDVVDSVLVLDTNGRPRRMRATELKFSYRNSILKETNDIVLSIQLFLKSADPALLCQERDEVIRNRYKVPFDLKAYPCAGSFFRNIEPTSLAQRRQAAGFFLEQAGAKSLAVGGAKVYEHHANMIIKSSGCRAQDVYELSRKMALLVKQKFDFDLVREVRFVGKFEGMTEKVENVIW